MTQTPVALAFLLIAVFAANLTGVQADAPDVVQCSTSARGTPLTHPIASEHEQLTDLWSSTLKSSAVQMLIKESLPAFNERDEERLLSMIEEVRPDEGAIHAHGLALTIPNLEPDYPVPGGQTAAYLLPLLPKWNADYHHSTHLGPTGNVSSDPIFKQPFHRRRTSSPLLNDRLLNMASELYAFYRDYRHWSQLLQKARTSVHADHRYSGFSQDYLLHRSDEIRGQLVTLAGFEAVDHLDRQLGNQR